MSSVLHGHVLVALGNLAKDEPLSHLQMNPTSCTQIEQTPVCVFCLRGNKVMGEGGGGGVTQSETRKPSQADQTTDRPVEGYGRAKEEKMGACYSARGKQRS